MIDHAVPLLESEADPDPVRQFQRWFAEVAGVVREPEAAALATATPDGRPSVRMVLVKQADERGFVFYTNYESRKGRELAENPWAALAYHWDPLGRQVRIEGPVERVTAKETAAYLAVRPRASRVSALASPQSTPVADRGRLERRVAELAARYDGAELPQAENWGGLRMTPERFEFWQSRRDRLHDRLLYTPGPGGGRWEITRLAP